MSENQRPTAHPISSIDKAFKTDGDTTLPELYLRPDTIAAPAFFVDRDLSVRWIAPGGNDPFSDALAGQIETLATHNVFKLLMGPAVEHCVHEWQSFFSFVYSVLKRSTASATFESGTSSIAPDRLPAAPPENNRETTDFSFGVESSSMIFDGTASVPLRIFGLAFETGTLFLIREGNSKPPLQTGKNTAERKGKERSTANWRLPVGVLCIQINDAHRLSDTMMPVAYFRLIRHIWNVTDELARSLGGKRVGCTGAQIHYVFTESAGRNPIFSAVCCATRMGTQIRALQGKQDSGDGGSEAIALQMGIATGTNDFPGIDAGCGNMPPVVPGGGIDQASLLSSIASKGEIWITKTAVTLLPQMLVDQIKIGVDHQGRFQPNFFTRVSDLQPTSGGKPLKSSMGTLPTTRIVELIPPKTDLSFLKEDSA
ncbi:adenylate/guanylate cyclase domain-containing protein [Desulfosarcina ovata]|uniref:Guanylate cyclase domain-containing protein n=1 Tax=Desulfosarcina ovata subsp. ovata TaxID=2752305 RepID=A0A5K8A6V4_9BACT|nr:adenylate/guanylate cyclase domain-containing protein [Desulfosarcina ovata]BBO88255.1 hypothetical protein DSCOOX_14350 [Desulfosarcina ovata subsp. ovata]